MGIDGGADLPAHALQSLGMRREKFTREKSPVGLRAQIEELQLADLVGDFGILSRRAADLRLQRMAERMIMGNLDEISGLAVAYGDIDGLKQINGAGGEDKGHDMGDASIVNVAEAISKVRPMDVVTRLGGDEFGVLMNAVDEAHAQLLMVGGVDHDGYIPRTQKAVNLGREGLKNHFGSRWVEGTPDKTYGNVTLGWTFLSREHFMSLYKQWRSDLTSNVPGTGDFSARIFGGADKAMFNQKT